MGTFKEINAGLETVAGISAAAAKAGVRKKGRLDLALFHSETPCLTAAFYTTTASTATTSRCAGNTS